jgi:diacylglycerol kinase
MRQSLWQSFQFASQGLQAAFRSQRTMRIHVLLAAVVTAAVAWLGLPVAETAVLVLAMACVLAAELMNTAVEVIVDLQVGDQHHELAGRAKDLSAAAVLVTAVGAAIVGVLVLAPPVAAALGLGRPDVLTFGRLGTLVAVLALVVIVLRRAGDRTARTGGTP